MDIPPHLQRMADEHTELSDRLTKLEAFIMGDNPHLLLLPALDQTLLASQHFAMKQYENVLALRVRRGMAALAG